MAEKKAQPKCERGKWFHVTFSTYGAWLPGDPRGYRTRGHREHVEGDYKRPPPPGYETARYERAQRNLKRSPVLLSIRQRSLGGHGLLDMLEARGCTVVAIGVGGKHVHIATRLPDLRAKLLIGEAKKHAWFVLKNGGFGGRAWAAGCRTEPIHDRSHQLNTVNYIQKHRKQGAWVWTWGEPRNWKSTLDWKTPRQARRLQSAGFDARITRPVA